MAARVKLSGWRRIADAMWQPPNDPQIYGALEVDATNLKRFLADCRALGHKVTPTHLVGRAVALTLRDVPELNVRLKNGYIEARDSAEIFFITAVEKGNDLTGVKIERAEHKSVVEVQEELTARSGAAKAGKDADLAKSKRTTDALPTSILRYALRFAAWITGDLNRSVPALGLKKSPFGSAAITNVGMFGLPMGFAPLSWMYGVPLLILVGTIEDKAVVIDGKVEVRPILPITATIDHRFVDGFHIARMMKIFRAYLDDPASFEPQVVENTRINRSVS